jgi:predicted O-linked N-acetylglucosamine transferase (SPINDLY family)
MTRASEDAAIAAAAIADAPFLGVDTAEIVKLSREWAARFGLSPKPARKHVAGDKLVIGYLVSAFIDADDAAAVAAVAQEHDRKGVSVLGFGLGAQTAEHNGLLTGSFTKWRDIGGLDPATLARTLSGDGVDLLIDAGGFASARQLQALTRFNTGLRLSWLGNHGGIVAPLYDARLPASDYPVLSGRKSERISGEGPIAFGADVRLAQLDEATVALWSAVLGAVPEAKFVLRARDMDGNANIARLIGLFGQNLAARIDLRHTAQVSEFYQAVDVSLLPLRGASPRAAAEALGNGVPVVALAGEPYGAFLAGRGLDQPFVAADAAQYRAAAIAMALSANARALPAIEYGAAKLARELENLATSFINRKNVA